MQKGVGTSLLLLEPAALGARTDGAKVDFEVHVLIGTHKRVSCHAWLCRDRRARCRMMPRATRSKASSAQNWTWMRDRAFCVDEK
ncbi:hypothetical protein IE81DRAFT_226401 [Ceraceosorus guamensis]|uniref:Uncharacterized protein n=1 Tax=Ceraceosorus guamensis TaxID=1522189 RepID=A0A316WAN5_9BASI|nr:hypothetical protein IE81DRAFT_226401 [Ceraceosorus guamensis]PWN45033.1 hypothetical protein IE81DRAFT_226401 [Ceraceosorus guamensis]